MNASVGMCDEINSKEKLKFGSHVIDWAWVVMEHGIAEEAS